MIQQPAGTPRRLGDHISEAHPGVPPSVRSDRRRVFPFLEVVGMASICLWLVRPAEQENNRSLRSRTYGQDLTIELSFARFTVPSTTAETSMLAILRQRRRVFGARSCTSRLFVILPVLPRHTLSLDGEETRSLSRALSPPTLAGRIMIRHAWPW